MSLFLTLLACASDYCQSLGPDGLRTAPDEQQEKYIKQCLQKQITNHNEAMITASFDSMDPPFYDHNSASRVLLGNYPISAQWSALTAAIEANDRALVSTLWRFRGSEKKYDNPTLCDEDLGCAAYFGLEQINIRSPK